jgi:hypothetical protein
MIRLLVVGSPSRGGAAYLASQMAVVARVVVLLAVFGYSDS